MGGIRNTPIRNLKGLVIGFFACMNGGKTEAEVRELERVIHSGYNAAAFNHGTNTRDGNFLAIDGRHKFPATGVRSIDDIKSTIVLLQEKIMSRKAGDQGRKGKITVNGIEYQKYAPLVGVGVDEINLFCLSENDATKTIDFMKWCRQNEMVLYVAGLLYDFRQMPFGYVHSILPYVNIKEDDVKPACKAAPRGTQCGSPAIHTMRLWRTDFVSQVGLDSMLSEMNLYTFADKKGKVFTDSYVPAPFFDQTVRIEEGKDGRNIYIPVCDDCAVLPYKEETFKVYDSIIRGKDAHQVLDNKLLTKQILQFLVREGWTQCEKREYRPVPYFRNRLGSFSQV